jgi:hypothetical protein
MSAHVAGVGVGVGVRVGVGVGVGVEVDGGVTSESIARTWRYALLVTPTSVIFSSNRLFVLVVTSVAPAQPQSVEVGVKPPLNVWMTAPPEASSRSWKMIGLPVCDERTCPAT